MELYRFINSKDIREYHKKIGYKYNALEAAWLVSQCNSTTLEKRHKAWHWIIDNMPDMEVKNYGRWTHYFKEESIHKLLMEYMEMENSFIKEFQNNAGGYLYKYRRYERSAERSYGISDFKGFFSSWDKCRSYILDTEDAEDAAFYEINRRRSDETEDHIIHGTIDIDIAGSILDVSADYEEEENERWFYLNTFFDELWSIPSWPIRCLAI